MVGSLGLEVAERSAKQGRLTRAGGAVRIGVGAPEVRVVQQLPHLLVPVTSQAGSPVAVRTGWTGP
jgi:hypothetical protein